MEHTYPCRHILHLFLASKENLEKYSVLEIVKESSLYFLSPSILKVKILVN